MLIEAAYFSWLKLGFARVALRMMSPEGHDDLTKSPRVTDNGSPGHL